MNKIAHATFPDRFEHLTARYDRDNQAIWYYMNARPRPCFTPALLAELKAFQAAVADGHVPGETETDLPVQYLIGSSMVPGVFNLGGDLDLFKTYINQRNRRGLLDYAKACVDVLYTNMVHLSRPLTTVSLINGNALGGGFEAALSSDVLIAERSVQMGLPEVLFNLFPGMGAYSMLSRRLDPARAEKFILSGRLYGAEELYEMGLVDVVAEDGEGEAAVREFMRRHGRGRNAQLAMRQVRERCNPIPYEELIDVTRIWVEAALRLEPKDLRTMDRLVRAQNRLVANDGAAGASGQCVA